MTPTGGTYGVGTVYQLQPQSNGTWNLNVIHTFTGGSDGLGGSAGRLILDRAGNLYGVTTVGGANGDGVVFEITPSNGTWTLTPLYAFKDQPDGAFPYGGLILHQAGNLYASFDFSAVNHLGTFYKLTDAIGARKA